MATATTPASSPPVVAVTANPARPPAQPGEAPAATFTLDHFQHMVACGAFSGEYEKRVELLWGRIVEMEPPGPFHCNETDLLNRWSVLATADKQIRVRVQQPISLPGSSSEPQPDICWAIERSYAQQHPNPSEVLLVIEVAHSSLPTDRGVKLAAYANAGVAEYWIVNLEESCVEVFRRPSGQGYDEKTVIRSGGSISPLTLPDAKLELATLFAD